MHRTKAVYTQGFVSVFANLGLFLLKLWAGIVTGSIALTADAWHTLSDSISSVAVILAARLSSKKPDRDHPFGHGRWEQIAALFIAFLLAIVAFDFLKDSIMRLYYRESVVFGLIAIIVTIISILAKEALAQYAFYVARKTNNLSVKADAWHHRTDSLSSVVLLVGILLAPRLWWIDGVLGIIISAMLFYATYEIAREAVMKLLGEKPNPELIHKIHLSVEKIHPQNLHLHHFHIHNYIAHQEMTFHIRLEKDMSIETGHQIASRIEKAIYDEFGIIATIHMEPKENVEAS
jgi:cation diffusion facilitator family transporter